MADLFLPKLKTDAAVAVPNSSGAWDFRPLATLDHLGDGLETEMNQASFSVDSIPDVWARPLLFQMALFDSEHSQHERVYEEWCGLAALIALKNWHGFALDALPVSLSDQDAKFARVAEKLAPKVSLSQDTNWLELFVFRFQSQPFAMTSPTTLFCTSAEYKLPGVPWHDGSRLHSPVAILGVPEKSAVRNWLDRLESDLSQLNLTPRLWNSLSEIFQRFQNELGTASSPSVSTKPNVLGLTVKGIFRYLDELPSGPSADINGSHVKLESTRTGASQREVLILDEKIADVWGVDKKDVVVIGGKTLANIPAHGLTGSQKQFDGLALPDGAEWWSKNHLFTEKLRIVESSDTFPGWIPPKGAQQLDASPIIPIREEILEFMPAQQLARRVEIESVDGGSYRVRITLPLKGTGGGTQDFPVEKIYGASEIDRLTSIPAVAVWPDMHSSGWDEYFTYYRGPQAFTAKPYPEPVDSRESRTKTTNDVTKAIYESKAFPEALACWDPTSTEFWGLIALSEPESVPPKNVTNWQVGIDFGTTNTIVYVQDGDGSRNLEFSNLLRHVTESEESQQQVDFEFLPSRSLPTPFPSIYHENIGGEDRVQATHPFYDGQIYYVPSILEEMLHTVFKKNKAIHSNLKWSDEPMDRIRAQCFLAQLVMQVKAEAEKQGVEKVNFAYSVPTSFSEGQRDNFKQLWKSIAGDGSPPPEERTESLCSALFYRNALNAPVVAGTICIDIGGESSDIGVWQGGRLCVQTSLRCASREIFGEALLIQPGLIRDILDYKDKILGLRALEILLRVREREAMERLNANNGSPEYLRLATHVAVGFSGILHYTGLLIKAMADRGRLKPTFEAVYIGGNGSKMLHWANGNEFTSNGGVGNLFGQVLRNASGSPETVEFKLTPQEKLKHEVAYGLVEPKMLDGEPQPVSILGERGQDSQGKSLDWSANVTKDLLYSGLELDAQPEQIKSLINSVNGFASQDDVNLSIIADVDKKLKEVRNATTNYLNGLTMQKPEDIHLEPPFVMELKKLLSELRKS